MNGNGMAVDASVTIEQGKTSLAIELGSTRIKAVLIGEEHTVLASGGYGWENKYENGVWTYDLNDVWVGLQDCYQSLVQNVREKYGVELTTVGSIGFSAMMHGYIPFDENDRLLTPFRTWRNTMTEKAAAELTEAFGFNMPQRWSTAYLWQAILDGEAHVRDIHYYTTLAGYVHWKLTGRKVIGIGDASGMFPIDSTINDYDSTMLHQFDELAAKHDIPWSLRDILPQVMLAGEAAGTLTDKGARLLDVTGKLQAGIPVCPPEGDADTGMVATNSVDVRTGNVSAGTSSFAMIVLEQALSEVHIEIDMITTPAGRPVAMVHTNTCTSDIDAWIKLFKEAAEALGATFDTNTLYNILYKKALEGDEDCGGLMAYNYYSGEPITEIVGGKPLLVREPDSRFSLANVMRTHLFSALGTLRIGMDILFDAEQVKVDIISGHGGFFKTEGVGQRIMAAALGTPVSVMETAGEGGAWGMALLAAYMLRKREGETLEAYLKNRVFAHTKESTLAPMQEDVRGFDAFLQRYKKGLVIEKVAVENMD